MKGVERLEAKRKQAAQAKPRPEPKRGGNADTNFFRKLRKQKYLLLMVFPGMALVFTFSYMPMYGILMAFQDYSPFKGVGNSPWVGLKHFENFLGNPFAQNVLKNTAILGVYGMLVFPLPIILTLLLNEVKLEWYKRTIQSIYYLPHFLSVVIVVGILKELASLDGLFNEMIGWFGMKPINFFGEAGYFRALFVWSGVWQGIGWSTIIYLAALTGVDPALYESAHMDGANRWQKAIYITLPSMQGTVVILFILSIGGMLNFDYQKILLMYNPATYATADVVGTYVYREGLVEARYSYSTAVGLLMSVISFVMLYTANRISRRLTDSSLW